uniref:Putative uracil DNA glycosylase superfamily protein n=1 Tax=viral metagenome TaxID=1070528 RepID=A0A6M3MEG6_9ZZZZ
MKKTEWLEEIKNNVMDCDKCPRLRSITPFPMSHICYGKLSGIKLFFIGRNPGIENDCRNISKEKFFEEYHYLWWECNIGKYLRKNFEDYFVKEKMFFTNVNKCSSPENSQLTEEEKANCLPFLRTQLEIVRPKVIVTFGSEARITIKSLNLGKVDIINLFHPAYFSYNRDPKLIEKQQKKIMELKDKYEEKQNYNWYTKEIIK